MKPACLTSKRKYFREKNYKGVILRPKRKQKLKRGDYPWKNGIHQLGFFLFPPFLGIDHLKNVSIKVLRYRVLGIGIDIDPALQSAYQSRMSDFRDIVEFRASAWLSEISRSSLSPCPLTAPVYGLVVRNLHILKRTWKVNDTYPSWSLLEVLQTPV